MTTRPYHIIVGALLFSLLMWISVNLGDEFHVTQHIPLTIEKFPEGKALKHPVPKTLTTRLRGTGWRLVSQHLFGDPQVVLDLSVTTPQSFVLTERDLRDRMKLTSGVQAVDISPDTLLLEFENYVEKIVRVKPLVTLDFRDGYGLIGELNVRPEVVTIGGGESVLGAIESWPTVRKEFTDLRESFSVGVPLEAPGVHSLRLLQTKVQISAIVQPFAEKTFLAIPVEVLAAPLNREVIFIPPRVDITARGGIDQLAALTNEHFRLTVDYQTLLLDTTGIVQPHVDAPTGIRVVVRRPERIQYIIRRRL